MRIAMVSLHSCPAAPLGLRDTGGMNVYVLNLARRLGLAGHEVDVFSRWHDPEDATVSDLGPGARIIHVESGPYDAPKANLHRYLPDFLSGLSRFAAEEGGGYDLVHSHYWLSGHVGMDLADQWGVPHVATFHTLAEAKRRALAGEHESELRGTTEARIAGVADAVVVSDRHERGLLERLYGIPTERLHVIPGGVDLDRFNPVSRADARKELGLNGEHVLLFVGRLDPLKGVDLLLQGAALLEERRNVRIIIVGGDLESDPEVPRLAEMAAQLGMADRVRFEGAVPQERLPSYYSAADLLVAPSYYESFGLTVLEAMACGIPVVAARAGGLRGLVRDGETGYLVPWHCPEPFAERMEVLLAHEDLREQMGQAGLLRAQNLTWGAMAEAVASLYGQLHDARRAAAPGAPW